MYIESNGTNDDHSPVLVGVSVVNQRFETAGEGRQAYQLMIDALVMASNDAGTSELLKQANAIQVPKGTWAYTNPANLLADAIGAKDARTVLSDIGILQQTLFSRACCQIVEGECDIVLVVGGEAKYRDLQATIAGLKLHDVGEQQVEPDVTLSPGAELRSQVERDAGFGMPVGDYAIIDSALRYKQNMSVDDHRDQMAATYQSFSHIAESNPDAWNRQRIDAAYIRNPSPKNKMLAFPYTKLHNSQWNVDQASALIFCSVAKARELKIDESQWVYPLASVESNHLSMVSERKELHRCPGFYHVGKKALMLTGKSIEQIEHRELYSCFPAAIRTQIVELGLNEGQSLSVTGAMTFAGGPLNNFVLQATVKMAQILRQHPGDTGLVTCVSGMLTKQACALWSTQANPRGFQFSDVSEAVASDTELCELVAGYRGTAVVAGYTVLYQGEQPYRGIAVVDIDDKRRTVVYTEESELMAEMLIGEFCGRFIQVFEEKFSAIIPTP